MLENFLNDDDDNNNKKRQFDNFVNCCAETILCALQVSNKEWLVKSRKDIHAKVFEIVHELISSVIGNRSMDCYEFEEADFDLIFVATMRRALTIAEGPGE